MHIRLLTLALFLAPACGDKDDPVDDTGAAEADADTDSDTDADTDSDTDVDTADWSHCPDSSAYAGDSSYGGSISASADAVYCSAWNEDRSLEEEQASLGKLRIVEGEYAIPVEDGEFDLVLPVCVARPDGLAQPDVLGSGSTSVTSTTWSGSTFTYLTGGQSIEEGDGSAWSLDHIVVLASDEGVAPEALPLDGGPSDEETGAGASFVMVPDGGTEFDNDALTFIPCSVDWWEENTHTVAFEGGEITMTIELGDNLTQTAPGRFRLAEGNLDGTDFSQDDRFKLIYNPGHHHFTRSFAVVFDSPIGDVCSLRVEDLDPYAETPSSTVSTGDCDLSVIETRAVSDETFSDG